jgi:hypothetical protein
MRHRRRTFPQSIDWFLPAKTAEKPLRPGAASLAAGLNPLVSTPAQGRTLIAERPPYRTVRVRLGHMAPTLGV